MKNIYGQQPIFFRATRNEEFNRLNELALEKEKEKKKKDPNVILEISCSIAISQIPIEYGGIVHGKSNVIHWSKYLASEKLISFLKENKFPFGYGSPPETIKPNDDEF